MDAEQWWMLGDHLTTLLTTNQYSRNPCLIHNLCMRFTVLHRTTECARCFIFSLWSIASTTPKLMHYSSFSMSFFPSLGPRWNSEECSIRFNNIFFFMSSMYIWRCIYFVLKSTFQDHYIPGCGEMEGSEPDMGEGIESVVFTLIAVSLYCIINFSQTKYHAQAFFFSLLYQLSVQYPLQMEILPQFMN